MNPPTLVHPQHSLINQGSSRASWIEWLSDESPEQAYLQGLVYLNEAFGWTEQMEEFLVPIIDVWRRIPGFKNLRKWDAHKWKQADNICRHYQTTPHEVEATWKAAMKWWGEDVTSHLHKLGSRYIYTLSCCKFLWVVIHEMGSCEKYNSALHIW